MRKYIPAFVVICALLLRLYKGPELFFWNIDEDIVGLTVKKMLLEHHPQLIGFPIPGGIYLGPLFYYIIAIPYFLVRFNVQWLYVFSAVLGALSTFLVYKVGSIIFEKKSVGIFASVIFAFSYFTTTYGRVLTGLSISPILALLTYLFLYQNLKFKKPKHLILLGVVLLVAAQNEGSSLSLLGLFLITWMVYRFALPISKLAQVAILFVLFHIPLLIFDLRHHFYISKSLLNFFAGKGVKAGGHFSFSSFLNIFQIFPNTLSRIFYPSGPLHTSDQILPCPDLISERINSIHAIPFMLAILVIGFFLFSLVYKKNKSLGEKIIGLHLFVACIGIILFNLFLKGYLFEWILIVFVPSFCFMVGLLLSYVFEKKLIYKIVALSITALFVFFNVKATLSSSDTYGLSGKLAAVDKAISIVGNEQFHLESIGSCYQTGYMYLFWMRAHFPTSSYADDMFANTFYERPSEVPQTTVVIANPSKTESYEYFEKYNQYKKLSSHSEKVGETEVLIIDGK